jgi:hypothetical protein
MSAVDPGPALPAGEAEAAPPDRLALTAAALTAALSFTSLADSTASFKFFILGACLFWGGFVAVRARQDRTAFRKWGFRSDNLLRASLIPAAAFVLGAAGLALVGWQLHGHLLFPAHALLMFLVYPVWGWVQQFLMLGVLATNLERAGLRHRKVLLVVAVALIFGLLHVSKWKLMLATFLVELAIVPMYLSERNLWPLGVLHGWLGGLFYLWVEHRDLWAEYFG